MRVDVELMFECLIYINAHYYPVFAITEASMTLAKYISEKKYTPNLGQDAIVCCTRLSVELIKLILFKQLKHTHRKLVTFLVLVLTLVTSATVYYTVFIQDPALKLENVLSSLTSMMVIAEFIFGIWFLLPWYEKVEFY